MAARHGACSCPAGTSLGLVCVVELPGAVKDPQAAVATVGGPTAVRQAMLRPDGQLRFRLCGEYQYQAAQMMRRRCTSDLLIRGRRKSDGSWEYELVAVVYVSFSAEAMVDFLFTPPASLGYGRYPVAGSIEQELRGYWPSEDPFMPPAFFTRVETPQPYGFEDNSFLRRHRVREEKKVLGTGEAKLKRAWINVSVYRFASKKPVPTVPPEGVEDMLREPERKVLEAMGTLFQERPVWLRGALEERLAELGLRPNVSIMQRTLQCISYLWSDGPWRQSYVRLGWDPRLHAEESRWLQVIDFRDRFFKQQRAYFEVIHSGNADRAQATKLDCHFRTPPVNRSQLYQFIDIEDVEVQQIIQAAPVEPACSVRFGWLPEDAVVAVRERMAKKAELLRRTREAARALQGPAAQLALPPPPGLQAENAVAETEPSASQQPVEQVLGRRLRINHKSPDLHPREPEPSMPDHATAASDGEGGTECVEGTDGRRRGHGTVRGSARGARRLQASRGAGRRLGRAAGQLATENESPLPLGGDVSNAGEVAEDVSISSRRVGMRGRASVGRGRGRRGVAKKSPVAQESVGLAQANEQPQVCDADPDVETVTVDVDVEPLQQQVQDSKLPKKRLRRLDPAATEQVPPLSLPPLESVLPPAVSPCVAVASSSPSPVRAPGRRMRRLKLAESDDEPPGAAVASIITTNSTGHATIVASIESQTLVVGPPEPLPPQAAGSDGSRTEAQPQRKRLRRVLSDSD